MPNKNKRDELGPDSAGQSGDIQQLSDVAAAGSESIEELAEEGNAFEADAVQGVEDAQPPDVSEVRTREVPEDDVPGEYLDTDEHVA
jgi:N utilization substance protein A